MKSSLETRLGYFVALVVISAIVILEIAGGFNRLRGGYRLFAQFDNAKELKPGDPVKLAGVQIGTVQSLDLTNNKVLVTLRIDRNREVRTDSKAKIDFAGLLGQNFITLDFGTPNGRKAEEGTVLATVEQADLGQLMAKLDKVADGVENITKGFAGDEVQNLASTITGFVKDNRDSIQASLNNISNITGQIKSGEGTIGKLIYTDALHNAALSAVTNLQAAADEAKTTLAEARKVVDEINAGRGTIGKLARDETLYNEATASMTNLKEILQKINRGEGTVGKLINEDTFLKNAKLTLQKLDKATESLEDQGPLSVLGTVAGSLF
jgi:phospholipid/cholesterol/gamma-HCH transport system substrate-binding protein